MIPPDGSLGKGARGAAMRAKRAIQLMAVLLLAGCGSPGRPPPPYFAIPAGPPAPQSTAPANTGLASGERVLPTSNPSVQYFLPSHPGDAGRGPAPVSRPDAATTPFYAAPPNLGPVTGYGPGGMAQPPGALPNPPYSH
jgi:hypothetical protein